MSRLASFRAVVPTHRVAHATEAVGTGGLHGFQHRPHALSQLQVGVSDDGCRSLSRAVVPSGAVIGDGLDVLDLAHGFHLIGAVGAVLAADLDENRRAHVVAAVDVGGQFRQQVSLVVNRFGPGNPEMVVGVADGELRFQSLFGGPGEPVVASRRHVGPPA